MDLLDTPNIFDKATDIGLAAADLSLGHTYGGDNIEVGLIREATLGKTCTDKLRENLHKKSNNDITESAALMRQTFISACSLIDYYNYSKKKNPLKVDYADNEVLIGSLLEACKIVGCKMEHVIKHFRNSACHFYEEMKMEGKNNYNPIIKELDELIGTDQLIFDNDNKVHTIIYQAQNLRFNAGNVCCAYFIYNKNNVFEQTLKREKPNAK